MKKIVFALIMFGGFLAFANCTKSETSGSDPNQFCNEAGCALSEANKQRCIEFYENCMAANPDANDDECVAGALAVCK